MANPISTGIIIISGKPGSGKSYYAVCQLLREVLIAKRLVYTNLPLDFKALRAYLYIQARYVYNHPVPVAKRLAKFVKPIGFHHFNAFAKRLHDISQRFEQLKIANGDNDLTADATFLDNQIFQQARKEIADEQGQEVITGQGANWLPSRCCLFLDELHKWYGNAMLQRQPAEILGYTSMHRHCKHKLFVLTQQSTNVAKSFRDNAVEYWHVVNLRNKKFIFCWRWPVQLFRYFKYSADDIINGQVRPGATPIESDFEWPRWNNYAIFRLYNSHTFDADSSDVQRQVDSLYQLTAKENESMKMPKTIWDKIIGLYFRILKWAFLWPFRHWKLSIILIVISVYMFKAGNGDFKKDRPKPSAKAEPKTEEPKKSNLDLSITGLTPKGVFVNGKFIELGKSWQGVTLQKVDIKNRCAVFAVGRDRVVWSMSGGLQPYKLVESENDFGCRFTEFKAVTPK